MLEKETRKRAIHTHIINGFLFDFAGPTFRVGIFFFLFGYGWYFVFDFEIEFWEADCSFLFLFLCASAVVVAKAFLEFQFQFRILGSIFAEKKNKKNYTMQSLSSSLFGVVWSQVKFLYIFFCLYFGRSNHFCETELFLVSLTYK